MFWKIETEICGSLPEIQVFIGTVVNPCLPDRQAFNILQRSKDWLITAFFVFMKIKPAIFGSAPGAEQAVMMGNPVGYVYEDKKGNIWTPSQSANDLRRALSRYDEKSLSNKKQL